MSVPYPCPECGGVLDLDTEAETPQEWFRVGIAAMSYTEEVLRPCIVAACTGCEFVIEVAA